VWRLEAGHSASVFTGAIAPELLTNPLAEIDLQQIDSKCRSKVRLVLQFDRNARVLDAADRLHFSYPAKLASRG